jgi:hypothetical protein
VVGSEVEAAVVEASSTDDVEAAVLVLVGEVADVGSAVVSAAGGGAPVVLAGGGRVSVEPLASTGSGSPQAASSASEARRGASTITSFARRRRGRQDRWVRGVA